MIRRFALICLVFGLFFALPETSNTALAQVQTQMRMRPTSMAADQIRQLPILMRPNRPGHFYGNTVRRLHARRMRGH